MLLLSFLPRKKLAWQIYVRVKARGSKRKKESKEEGNKKLNEMKEQEEGSTWKAEGQYATKSTFSQLKPK